MSKKHTIDQLEQLIDEEEDAISILPNGTIVVQAKPAREAKVLTKNLDLPSNY